MEEKKETHNERWRLMKKIYKDVDPFNFIEFMLLFFFSMLFFLCWF